MDEPGTISKKAYDRLVFWLTMLIVIVVNVVAVLVRMTGWVRIEPGVLMGVLCGMTVAYMALARALADRILRRRGLTLRGIASEVYARSPFGSAEDVPPGEMVEARVPREMILFLLIAAPFLSLFMFFGAWFLREEFWLRWLCYGMAAFFLVCWVENILDYGKPIARVDADGVYGYPSRRALWRRFVPWADVFSCEVQTLHDTFGKVVLLRPVLKGRHGEKLMELCLFHTPMVEQERIVKAIKVRLPETEVEAWAT